MKLLSEGLLLIFLLPVFSQAGMFSDFVKGLINSGRYSNIFGQLNQGVVSGLEDTESSAAKFVCDLFHGDVPGILDDIVDEVKEDFQALTSFVEGVTVWAPAVLSDIEKGGEDVASVVEELITDPGDAVTVIVGGIETAFSDVTAFLGSVGCDILEIFGACTPQSRLQSESMESACSASTRYAAVTTTKAATTTHRTTSTPKPAATATTHVASSTMSETPVSTPTATANSEASRITYGRGLLLSTIMLILRIPAVL